MKYVTLKGYANSVLILLFLLPTVVNRKNRDSSFKNLEVQNRLVDVMPNAKYAQTQRIIVSNVLLVTLETNIYLVNVKMDIMIIMEVQ